MEVRRNEVQTATYNIMCSEQERADIVDALTNIVLSSTSTTNRNERMNEIAFKLKDANPNEHW